MSDKYGQWKVWNSLGEWPLKMGEYAQVQLASETRIQAELTEAMSSKGWEEKIEHNKIIAYRIYYKRIKTEFHIQDNGDIFDGHRKTSGFRNFDVVIQGNKIEAKWSD